MTKSLNTDETPPQRSAVGTPVAHNTPITASSQNRIGRPPAGVATTLRRPGPFNVGTSAISQSTSRTEVADVDHGSETASPQARTSAASSQRSSSNTLASKNLWPRNRAPHVAIQDSCGD